MGNCPSRWVSPKVDAGRKNVRINCLLTVNGTNRRDIRSGREYIVVPHLNSKYFLLISDVVVISVISKVYNVER